MSYSNRIFLYGPVAALFVLAAGYSLYWWHAAARLDAQLQAANHTEILPGLTFAFAEKTVGGFPFRLDASLGGVTFALKGKSGETAWRSERLALHALTYSRAQYIFEAAGLQSIAYPGTNGLQVYYLTPGTARASALLRGGRVNRFDLDIARAKIQDATAKTPARDATTARVQFHIRRNADKLEYAARLDGLNMGAGYESKLGHTIQSLTANGTVSQAATLDTLLRGGNSFDGAFESWRVGAGAIVVDALSVTSDTAKDQTLTGLLTLDANHDLSGTLAAPSGGLTLALP